mgnify:CR=1 FL=1
MSKSATPLMQQYEEIKARHRDAILFFRMGDFFEMFYEDAETAARIALELKDKVAKLQLGPSAAVVGEAAVPDGPFDDALSALVNLGYAQAQASAAIASVIKREGEDIPAAQLIRLGLKEMAK